MVVAFRFVMIDGKRDGGVAEVAERKKSESESQALTGNHHNAQPVLLCVSYTPVNEVAVITIHKN